MFRHSALQLTNCLKNFNYHLLNLLNYYSFKLPHLSPDLDPLISLQSL